MCVCVGGMVSVKCSWFLVMKYENYASDKDDDDDDDYDRAKSLQDCLKFGCFKMIVEAYFLFLLRQQQHITMMVTTTHITINGMTVPKMIPRSVPFGS